MEKLKLNIQKFASTNSTTHYNLSQYIATDKPTYLVDYNGDMLKIDTAIYNAMSKATDNETHIGTMNNLTTTEKSNLVGAINEVNTQVGTNTGNISQNTLDISANSTKIGSLVDLATTYKTNLVGAINEVKAEANINKDNIEKFNFTNFKTYSTNEITVSQGTISNTSLTVATNNDGSIGKIYGELTLALSNVSGPVTLKLQSALRPTNYIYINLLGSLIYFTSQGITNVYSQGLSIKTNGEIEFAINVDPSTTNVRFIYIPALLFMKDFGDTPNI